MIDEIIITTQFNKKVLNIEFKNLDKSNAISNKMLNELEILFKKKKYINSFSCIVFKGYNNGPFSSGADLSDINKNRGLSLKVYQRKLHIFLNTLNTINVPKISFINSYCYGAGLLIAMYTDITICNDNAEFCIPAVKLGIKLPKKIIKYILSKNINNFFFKDIMISGRKFLANEAYNAKMISMVLNNDSYRNECNNYIFNITKNNSATISYYTRN